MKVAMHTAESGTSGAFLGSDSHNKQWWVKPLNNKQGERVVITEAIVGTVGRLIGAPVCQTAIVRIPDSLQGQKLGRGLRLEPGLAHASRKVDAADEYRFLRYRDRDQNRVRHAGVFALYDWCWGGDDQWLYSGAADCELFSHDHGYYLPDVGPSWSEDSLMAHVDQPHPLRASTDGLDRTEIIRLASELRKLDATSLVESLRMIPQQWPVTDEELECVGWFLQRRAKAVANRLDSYHRVSK